MEIILIKLSIAHLLGDFFLQPDKWVEEKERLKLRSSKLYIHVAVHIALTLIVLYSLDSWKAALLIGVFHLAIDAAKLWFQKPRTKRLWFFIDQILHFLTIFAVAWICTGMPNISIPVAIQPNVWLLICFALFLTMPAATMIRVVIARWIPDSSLGASGSQKSLQDAGKFIGILERLLIYVFVLTNHFEAVGFLLAAKSIFRFGDLKEAHDIKLTEYVLIGTLLSFGIAIIVALGTTFII
ncbi:DUF3307 domain-containing protein [Pedobacter sp. SYP-B3415]|uniref:DUF3307 domain-containing protein n=1 Tax=Pedobacter sp. SYP-B3415 TaxID=2496641 RepID=UPI00101CE0B3|nr:DUF3307 domain-containing protein [Pedobacter sp. SYP-B3415]